MQSRNSSARASAQSQTTATHPLQRPSNSPAAPPRRRTASLRVSPAPALPDGTLSADAAVTSGATITAGLAGALVGRTAPGGSVNLATYCAEVVKSTKLEAALLQVQGKLDTAEKQLAKMHLELEALKASQGGSP